MALKTKYCPVCKRTKREVEFFRTRDGGHSDKCKLCETMFVDNLKPVTFIPLLQKYDIPYLEDIWVKIYQTAYDKDPFAITGNTVFGKYLSRMKISPWNQYRFKDTMDLWEQHHVTDKQLEVPAEILAEMAEAKKQEETTIDGSQYDVELPPELLQKDNVTLAKMFPPPPQIKEREKLKQTMSTINYPDNHPFEEVEMPSVSGMLTAEDKLYLATKWGKFYEPEEWVYLEKKYVDFMQSFDIQGAAREDTLIQICKLSLKMNIALDSGDYDAYAKLTRAYDSLMKAAKFRTWTMKYFSQLLLGVA